MKRKIIKTAALLLAVMGLCVIVGCSEATEPSESQVTETGGILETVRIGVLRIDDSIPLYVAEKDGMFAQCGASVELIEFGSASDQMKAAEAGEIDLIMTDLPVICLLKKGGADFKVVAMALGANQNEGRFLVLSAPDSAITEPEDLYGASVAISENTMMDYLVEQYAQLLGLDDSRIEKLHIPSLSLRLDALLSGQVDAAILPDPLAAYAVSQGANIVIDDTALEKNLSQSVFAVSSRLIDKNPQLVEKLLEAIQNAMAAINDTPEIYREYCLEVANVPAVLGASYPVPSYTPNVVPNMEDVNRVIDWMISRGLLSKPYTYEQIVDSSFTV